MRSRPLRGNRGTSVSRRQSDDVAVSVFDRSHVHTAMMLYSTLSSVSVAIALFATAFGRADSHVESTAPQKLPLAQFALKASAGDSLYTEEQATAGQAVFTKVCVECHEKKDIAGTDFRAKWTGRPLFDLYELIRTTMPDSNPGGMSRDEYAAATAYILKENGLPAGTKAIMPDSAAMQAVKLELPPR